MLIKKNTILTSSTLGGLDECCLEHSPGPWSWHKAVRVPDNRKYHGRGGFYCFLNLFPSTLFVNTNLKINKIVYTLKKIDG